MSEREGSNPGARDASSGIEMAFRHTVGRVIPRSGCVPAEPASVSPGARTIPESSRADKATCSGNGKRNFPWGWCERAGIGKKNDRWK